MSFDDPQRRTNRIESVQGGDGGWSVTFDDGFSFWIRAKHGTTPMVGDAVTLWGRGIGYPVRGLAINGRVLYFETAEEYDRRAAAEIAERNRATKAQADAERAERDARVAALPAPFRRRIMRFRSHNPDFYWQYEPYEMSACEDAVRIAATVPAGADPARWLGDFNAKSWKEQKRIVPELYDGHSGNSFAMAVRLAHYYLTDERLVFADHAAIALVTGCRCGCPPVTDEEMVEAGYRPFGEEER